MKHAFSADKVLLLGWLAGRMLVLDFCLRLGLMSWSQSVCIMTGTTFATSEQTESLRHCVGPEQCSQGSRNVPNVPDVPNVPNVPNNVPNIPGHGGQDGLLAEGYVAKISMLILVTYPEAEPSHHSKPKSELTSPDFNMLTFGVLG